MNYILRMMILIFMPVAYCTCSENFEDFLKKMVKAA